MKDRSPSNIVWKKNSRSLRIFTISTVVGTTEMTSPACRKKRGATGRGQAGGARTLEGGVMRKGKAKKQEENPYNVKKEEGIKHGSIRLLIQCFWIYTI